MRALLPIVALLAACGGPRMGDHPPIAGHRTKPPNEMAAQEEPGNPPGHGTDPCTVTEVHEKWVVLNKGRVHDIRPGDELAILRGEVVVAIVVVVETEEQTATAAYDVRVRGQHARVGDLAETYDG